jgi:hypothetical protein
VLVELGVVEQRYEAVREVLDGVPVTEVARRHRRAAAGTTRRLDTGTELSRGYRNLTLCAADGLACPLVRHASLQCLATLARTASAAVVGDLDKVVSSGAT